MNDVLDNRIVVIPIKAEAYLPKNYGYKTPLVKWTLAIVPQANNNNPDPWWIVDAVTWKNLKDGSVWSDIMDEPIWDTAEFLNRKTGEVYHRDVRGLIGVSLARVACEVMGLPVPEVKRPHKVRTCNFRCINFERVDVEGKSTTMSREEGAEDPCMWCKARQEFIDEQEVAYFNQNRMKESGDLIDAYGRTYMTNGFCGPRIMRKVHKMDPDSIKQSMEQDREHQELSEVLKEHNMTIIGNYLKAGHTLHVENPRFVADRYGCFGETEFVESDIAIAQKIMSQEGDVEELKKQALEAIYQNSYNDYEAKNKAYEAWLDRELMKEIRAVDETAHQEIEAPTVETHVELVVADAPVTMNTLRSNLSWSEGSGCPYYVYYSRKRKVGDKWYDARFQAEPGHVAVVNNTKPYIQTVLGDVEVLWDREVVQVFSQQPNGSMKELDKKSSYGVAIDTLHRAGIKLEEVMK